MKPNIPWSVKGIDPEAREAAKTAARRAGMTLGEWLNSLILQSGELPEGVEFFEEDDEDLPQPQRPAQPTGHRHAAEEPPMSESGVRRAASEPQSNPQSLAVSGIDESIERLASTIESSRGMFSGAEADNKRLLEDLGERMKRLEHRISDSSAHGGGIDQRTLQALERAIAGVATHIEKSDRRNTELVASVEQALGELSARVSGVEESASDAIGRLELSHDRVAGRIEQVEGEQRRSAARLNERYAGLDLRLADLADSTEAGPAGLTDRLEALDRRLGHTEAEMARTLPSLGRDVVMRDELRRIEDRIQDRIESSERANREALDRTLADLDARLGGLTDRLDRLYTLTESKTDESVREAREALRLADEKIAKSEVRSAAAVQSVEDRIAQFAVEADKTQHTTAAALGAMRDVMTQLSRKIDHLSGKPVSAVPLAGASAHEISERLADIVPPPPAAPAETEKAPAEETSHWHRWGAPETEEAATGDDGTVDEIDESALESAEELSFEEEGGNEEAPAEFETETGALDAEEEETTPAVRSWHERVFGRRHVEPEAEPEAELPDDELDETALESAQDGAEDELEGEAEEDAGIADGDIVEIGLDEAEDTADTEDSDRTGLLDRLDFTNIRQSISEQSEDETEPAPAHWDDEPVEELAEELDEADDGDDYLAQARLAARSAADYDRGAGSLLDTEDQERSWLSSWVTWVLLIGVLALLGALIYLVGLPWLKADSSQNSAAPKPVIAEKVTAPQSPAGDAAGVEGLAPEEGGLAEDAAEPSTDAEAAGAPDDEAADAADEAPPATAEEALQLAAEKGEPEAQYALALAYQSGQGVPEDAAEAATWMRAAASNEFPPAQFGLGYILEKGAGVPVDLSEARLLYERAARGGNFKAMHNLAMFHVEGKGGLPQDPAKAERWFKEAAELGLVDSQINLAILYHSGPEFGLERSEAEAYFWYTIAGNQGEASAKDVAAKLAETLDPEVKAEQDKLIAEWKPKKPNLMANGGFDTSAEHFLPPEARTPLTRPELERIQDMLNALGYDAGSADGRIGEKTVSAIETFQADYGLKVTGLADRSLLIALGMVPR